jgi:hypothetical protein
MEFRTMKYPREKIRRLVRPASSAQKWRGCSLDGVMRRVFHAIALKKKLFVNATGSKQGEDDSYDSIP